MRRTARTAWVMCLAVSALTLGLLTTFAIRVEEWRTGDQGLAPLTYQPAQPHSGTSGLWIDTDAACGHTERTDPDDCFAIALLVQSGPDISALLSITGIINSG